MANEMTSAAPDVVQCPVCFKDFKPATINGHLDLCLQENVTDTSPSANDDGGPPLKKCRVNVEVSPPSPSVNNPVSSSCSGTGTSAMFSLFHTSKIKVSVQSKQSAASAGNKGVKCGLQDEAESGPADPETLQIQSPVSIRHTPNDISPRKLLTMDKPLAEILRPNTLEDYFGQSKVVGQQTLIRSLLDSQEIPSLILWGPPGCGKVKMHTPHSSFSQKRFLLFDLYNDRTEITIKVTCIQDVERGDYSVLFVRPELDHMLLDVTYLFSFSDHPGSHNCQRQQKEWHGSFCHPVCYQHIHQ